MTIIVFLVDTSASMNQRALIGGRPMLLDVAKNAVDSFIKVRQKSPDSRLDRYILMTFEDPPNNIKIGWKDNMLTFNNELKQLRSVSLTTLGAALKNTFDFLNLNRMMSGIDTFGMGRNPYFLENAVIVFITDGGCLTSVKGVTDQLDIPTNPMIPGGDLSRDPFRWDQRLFSLVLRLAGTPSLEDNSLSLVPPDNSPIETMCERTGGRSYCITTHRMLLQCIDSLVSKIQSGVVLHFEKSGPEPPPVAVERNDDGTPGSRPPSPPNGVQPWHSCRRMIFVPRKRIERDPSQYGHWPIPESFWPDINAPSLPPRPAHPSIKFSCLDSEVMSIENLPFDKYELEPSPLTLFILSRKQHNVCWQVFVPNSSKNVEVSHPFGYLKANTSLQSVNLFVMPYNYPVLLPLLEEVIKVHRMKPPREWRVQFDNYVRSMPSYYMGPLKKALNRMGCGHLLMDVQEPGLSYTVANYLKKVKAMAKQEQERQTQEAIIAREAQYQTDSVRKLTINPKTRLLSHPALAQIPKFKALTEGNVPTDFPLVIPSENTERCKTRSVDPLRHPYEIPRSAILATLARHNAQQHLIDVDAVHNVPISQMGNYQDYSKRVPPLREVETPAHRSHMFGNPFKKMAMLVDEADMDMISLPSGASNNKRKADATRGPGAPPGLPQNKRRRGPLPRDFVWKPRGGSVSSTPTSSPAPSPSQSPSVIDVEDDVFEPQFSPPAGDDDEPTPLIILDDDVITGSSSCSSSAETDQSSTPPSAPSNTDSAAPNSLPPPDPPKPPRPRPVLNVNGVIPFPAPSQPSPASPTGDIPVTANGAIQGSSGSTNSLSSRISSSTSDGDSYDARDVQDHNWQLKKKAMRLVRTPGIRDADQFVDVIYNLKGDLDTRIQFTEEVIEEILTFKKRSLASKMRNFLNYLQQLKRQLDWQGHKTHSQQAQTMNHVAPS
ncbi:unnamed protein product [Cyprideis torosa]|uniref:Uncharacterized protein n=1 Tax=Cyprideis torosa TaxID=163714 RepID=A0A7R8ZL05_9CRUS|nr:unnamed protein product [Cyprideis torosa]CAG0882627.1 unnamed protein product [Cyprideis torosa]